MNPQMKNNITKVFSVIWICFIIFRWQRRTPFLQGYRENWCGWEGHLVPCWHNFAWKGLCIGKLCILLYSCGPISRLDWGHHGWLYWWTSYGKFGLGKKFICTKFGIRCRIRRTERRPIIRLMDESWYDYFVTFSTGLEKKLKKYYSFYFIYVFTNYWYSILIAQISIDEISREYTRSWNWQFSFRNFSTHCGHLLRKSYNFKFIYP